MKWQRKRDENMKQSYLNDCKTPNLGDRIGCEMGMDWGNILLGGCRLLQKEEKNIHIFKWICESKNELSITK